MLFVGERLGELLQTTLLFDASLPRRTHMIPQSWLPAGETATPWPMAQGPASLNYTRTLIRYSKGFLEARQGQSFLWNVQVLNTVGLLSQSFTTWSILIWLELSFWIVWYLESFLLFVFVNHHCFPQWLYHFTSPLGWMIDFPLTSSPFCYCSVFSLRRSEGSA